MLFGQFPERRPDPDLDGIGCLCPLDLPQTQEHRRL